MVLASLALGAVSYRYVEQPVRLAAGFRTTRWLLVSYGGGLALSLGFVALAFLNRDFPNRLPQYMQPVELARRDQHARDGVFQGRQFQQKGDRDLLQFRHRGGRG